MNGRFQSDHLSYSGDDAYPFDNLFKGYIVKEKDSTPDVMGRTFHAIVSSNKSISIGTIAWNGSSWTSNGLSGSAQTTAGEYKEISALVTSTSRIDRLYAIMVSNYSGAWAKIHRVWIT